MTAFLEKVARGIIRAELGSRYPSLGTEDDVHVTQADMVRARAAVEAMRMPSEEMIEAGENDGGHSVYRWRWWAKLSGVDGVYRTPLGWVSFRSRMVE
jgi:hypothetical protein